MQTVAMRPILTCRWDFCKLKVVEHCCLKSLLVTYSKYKVRGFHHAKSSDDEEENVGGVNWCHPIG